MDYASFRLFERPGRWVGALGVMLAVLVGSFLWELPVSDPDLSLTVVWPERLSRSTDAALIVVGVEEDWSIPRRPLKGATMRLFQVDRGPEDHRSAAEFIVDGELRLISEGVADDAGQVSLRLPHVEVLAEGGAPSAGGLGMLPGRSVELVVEVEHQGRVEWVHRGFGPPPGAAMAISVDRPLYQPGQTVKARLLMVDPDTGRPEGGGQARWEVRDPRGNLILRREAPVSASGIASVEVPLSPDGAQGVYAIHAAAGEVSSTRTVEVQPFQLPRYKVTVKPDAEAIEGGETLTGVVEAITTWGDPVEGAEAEVVLRFPREGASGEERVKGVTDASGRLAWSLKVPPDASGRVEIVGLVSSESGRAERGVGSARIGGGAVGLELLPLGGGGLWRQHQLNEGALIVSDSAGRPIAGAQVVLWLPESREEARVALQTDAAGRATFTWTPAHFGQQARAEITLPGGALIKRRLTPPVGGGTLALELGSPRAQVGEPLRFVLRGMHEDVTVVATNRRYPVGGVRVPYAQRAEQEVSLVLDGRARGLTVLTVLGASGNTEVTAPVWVAQEGGDAVELTLDREEVRPGESAKLALAFPPLEGQASEVTFGVVGVDEALYALRERTDQPLSILLRHDPEQVEAAAFALAESQRPVDPQDALGRRVQAARFQQTIASSLGGGAWGYSGYGSSQLSEEVGRLRRVPWARGWALLLAALAAGLTYVGLRATWRPLGRSDFSVKRVFAFLGVAAAGLVLMALAVSVSPEYASGALTVWGVVLVCWLIAAARRRSELPLSLWEWCTLGLLIVQLGLLVTLAANDGSRGVLSGPVGVALVIVGYGVPLLLLLVEVVLWGMMLTARRIYKGGLGLASVVGVLLGLVLGSVFAISGRSYDGGFAKYAEEAPTMASSPAPLMQRVMGEEGMLGDREAKEEGGRFDDAPAKPPADSDAPAGPRVRSYFPETMLWLPEVRGDAQGVARLDLQAPDSITTWRLNATANTSDGRFGEGQAGLRVVQPFVVQLELPTHMTQDDTLEVPVVLINRSDAAVTPRLEVEATGGLRLLGGLPPELEVASGEQQVLRLSVAAELPGEGKLTVKGSLPGGGDAVQRAVAIAPNGRLITRSRSGIVGEGWKAELEVPGAALPGASSSRVHVYPSVVADALDGLEGMLRMPNGCFEQSASATFPNALILQTLRETPAERWPGGAEVHAQALLDADERLALGYQKLLAYQRSDGGFGLYPESLESDLMLTAYGVMQLTTLREVIAVDDEVIRRAVNYLRIHQNKSGSWPAYAGRVGGGEWRGSQDPGQVRSTAFIAWAILLTPDAPQHAEPLKRAMDHLTAHLDALDSPDALAWAANALLAAKRQDEADRALTRLAGMAKRDGDLVYWPARWNTWMGGWGRYADLELTALASYALLSAEREPELLSGALRYLASSRSPWGGWGTTQSTAWTLRTLARLRAAKDAPVNLTFTLDGLPLQEDRPGVDAQAGTLRVEPGDVLMHTLRPTRPVEPGPHTLQVTSSSRSASMTQASVTYAVPWASPLADVPDERLKLTARPQATSTPRGRDLWIEVSARNPVADPLAATIVELPRPPGAWVDPQPFELMRQQGGIDRFEILPTHIRLYLSGFQPESARTFRYAVRPLMRGHFALPPARAYAFYVPDPISEVPGGRVIVE